MMHSQEDGWAISIALFVAGTIIALAISYVEAQYGEPSSVWFWTMIGVM